MQCDKCRNEAILFQPSSGRHLCGRHLAADIEVRAKRSIRSHRWMKTGDHIAVIVTGDKKSAALLIFLKKLIAGRRDIRLSAIPAGKDETDGCCPSAVPWGCGVLRDPRCRDTGAGRSRNRCTRAPHEDCAGRSRWTISRRRCWSGSSLVMRKTSSILNRPQRAGYRSSARSSRSLRKNWISTGTVRRRGLALHPCPPLQDPLSREVETLFRDYHRRHPATRFALLNLAEELSSGDVAGIAAADRAGHGLNRREFQER